MKSKVFDLTLPEHISKIDGLIKRLNESLAQSPHMNNGNYSNLKNEIQNYLAFHLLESVNGEPIAFSGLYNRDFLNTEQARALNRTFYFPFSRSKSIGWNDNRAIASQIFAPLQVQKAMEIGLESIFVSIQGEKRRGAAQRLCTNLNKFCTNSPYPWTTLDGYYNTCRQAKNGKTLPLNKSLTCWQTIIFLPLSPHSKLNLPFSKLYPSQNKTT